MFAARLAEIHFFASDVPYNDQWVIEAQQILVPWANGTLGLRDFFIPHFEHLPVWTRLLVWLQASLTGRWDPLVQMTVNAAFYSAFAWLAARWIWSVLRPGPAVAVTLLLLAGWLLAARVGKTSRGVSRSQFPLALIAVFLHVHGSCTAPAGSRSWWLAQAAGVAGLFTIATFWLAPFALVTSWLWTDPRRRADLLVPGLIAATGAVLLLLIHRSVDNSFTQGVHSPLAFAHSALHLLGWPSVLPGAIAIVQLPWLAHALRLRRQAGAAPVDRVIFVFGLFNILQAIALAFGRVGDSNDFVSRYGDDLLFVGVLAGAVALCRLLPREGRDRTLFFATTVLWVTLVVAGLVRNSTGGHAAISTSTRQENAALRRTAVQNYLRNGDRTVIDQPATRWVLFYDADLVTRLLDQPKIRALLPTPVNPASPPRCRRQSRARVAGALGVVRCRRRTVGSRRPRGARLAREHRRPACPFALVR